MNKDFTHLELLRDLKIFNREEDRKYLKNNCVTFLDKVYGFVKKLHYNGVEDSKVRRDFKYLKKQGVNSLVGVLMEHPVFEYEVDLRKGIDFHCSKNWDYFMFLFNKL